MKVIFNPIKECYINQIVKSDVENITKLQAIKEQPLIWCNDFLFFIEDYESKEIIAKQTEGILHLQSLVYTKSKKIKESKWNGMSIEVLDFTGYSIYEDLTKFILEFEK